MAKPPHIVHQKTYFLIPPPPELPPPVIQIRYVSFDELIYNNASFIFQNSQTSNNTVVTDASCFKEINIQIKRAAIISVSKLNYLSV